MRKLRTAIIGLEHTHVGNFYLQLSGHEEIEWVGMAEVAPCTEEELQKRLELNARQAKDKLPLWKDYKELLAQNLDLAIICTNIQRHAAVAEETLALGIHTLVEKPMALTMEDARRMYRAYKKSSAELMINWPIAAMPAFNKAKELADSGIVGDVLRVQYRSPSTRGPYKPEKNVLEELSKMWWYKHEEGGGSICDYAGYGCVVAAWITGKKAKRVSGFKKNFFLPFADVEDYSVFTIDFGDCIGLVEGSWSTTSNGEIPTGPIVYGSEGIIVADRYSSEVKVYKEPYSPSPKPDEVYVTEPAVFCVIDNIVDFLLRGKPLHEMLTPEFNMRAESILDAGRRSCESGQTEYAEEPLQF